MMDVATALWAAQIADGVQSFGLFAGSIGLLGALASLVAWGDAQQREKQALAFAFGRWFLMLAIAGFAANLIVPSGKIIKVAAGLEMVK